MANDSSPNPATPPEPTTPTAAPPPVTSVDSASTPAGSAPAGSEPSPSPAGPDGKPDQPALTADALADGTTPTILEAGRGTAKPAIKKGVASLTSIYRRADIITTLLTLGGTLVAAGIAVGIYLYINRNQAKPAPAPKVTTLDQADLAKLGAFFEGNSVGTAGQVLTVSSASFFKQRVAVGTDLKVAGGIEVGGPTSIADLAVSKTSNLGVANVRGQLTVAGPTTLQSPAILAAGASITGNLTASGNGSFGGSLSAGQLNVRDLSVSGTLNLAGHLAVTGQIPTAAPASEAGAGANAVVDGNDSAGTVTINTGNVAVKAPDIGGLLVQVTFRTPYAKTPRVLITPATQAAGALPYYVIKTDKYFIIATSASARSSTGYSFDYWVVQ